MAQKLSLSNFKLANDAIQVIKALFKYKLIFNLVTGANEIGLFRHSCAIKWYIP